MKRINIIHIRKYIAALITVLIIFSSAKPIFASLIDGYNEKVLTNENIAIGTNYTEMALSNGNGSNQRINIVTADLNNSGVDIITSKPKDLGVALEPLSQQIRREEFKGNNVIAGINADMFDMYLGDSMGMQIKDGSIISAPLNTSYPMFGIDSSKNPFIDKVTSNSILTVIDSVYESVYGKEAPLDTINIDGINRTIDAYSNGILIITPQYKATGQAVTSKKAALTVIKGIKSPIVPGNIYEGIVESVGYGINCVDIPQDGIVLASTGTKADWVKDHIKSGDKIRFSIDINRNNIKEALSGYLLFVKNGHPLSVDEMKAEGASDALINTMKPRTAIGITSDKKVIAVTVDGGQPSYGISDGVTLTQMAQIMANLGAVQALSLDGGGSTEMMVKRFGDSDVSIVNRPSDGSERAITNALLFVSKAPTTGIVGNIRVDSNITIYKNSKYQFKVKATDTNSNPIDLSNKKVIWTSDNKIGNIDSNGLFTAGNSSAEGIVTATIDNVSGSANVKVIDSVYSINLTDNGVVTIDNGKTRQFNIVAATADGTPIIIDNSAATWSVDGNIGSIDANGLFTAGNSQGEGSITATLDGKSASVKVIVGQKEMMIDNFEHNDNARYKPISGYVGGEGEISDEEAKSGKYSYKISYDYDKIWTRKYNGTINFIPSYVDKNGNDIKNNYVTNIRPKKFGMWVYGDGHAPWLRVILIDGNGQKRTYDLASRINWTGWKYVDVSIPQDVPLPLSLYYIYMVETDKSLHYKGTVYFDDIRFVYTDDEDLQGPTFSNPSPSNNIVYSKDVELSVNISDDKSGVDKNSINAKLDGNIVNVNYDETTGKAVYFAKDLSEGKHTFEVDVKDLAGNYANPPFIKTFTVNLQQDNEPPIISNILPIDGSVVKTPTPRISVNIRDIQSGVDVKDIEIILDGKKVTPYYDESSGIAYIIPDQLSPGQHTVIASAYDKAGNKSETLIKVKDVAQDIGASLSWDGAARKLTVAKDDINLVLTIDSNIALLNGKSIALKIPVTLIDSTTYAPLSILKQAFFKYFNDELNEKYPDGLKSTFTIEPIAAPKDPNNFSFSVTSDTHATDYANYFFNMINNDGSDFVIQNGDLVDNDLPEQWSKANDQLKLIKKPTFFSPGNHEAFKGSLNNFINYYGLPTYSFEYGNSLFISLNSALGQSISASDPTQFDYLKRVLEKNNKKNVFIYTHVLTRDNFGTQHQMLKSDADELESILSDYKKSNPDKNINVIFGHIHSVQSWDLNGVTYTVSGDEAGKQYVKPEDGGILAYTKFNVSGDKISHEFIPLVKNVSIKDNSLKDGILELPLDATKKLNLVGDFSILYSDYIISLSNFKDISAKWSSDKPDIVSVSNDGIITANKSGTAYINVDVSGKSYTIKVNVPKAKEDLNGDGKISIGDIGILARDYGKDSKSTDWDKINFEDLNNDGSIDIDDLVIVAKLILK